MISKSSRCPILNKILALQEQFQNLPYKQPARKFLPVRKFGTLSVAPDLATTRRQGCLYEKVVAMINKPNQGQTLSRLSNKHCQVCIPQRLGSLPSSSSSSIPLTLYSSYRSILFCKLFLKNV